MSAPVLTPLETPIFDDDVIADLEEHIGDEVMCERPAGCDRPAVARMVVLRGCPKVRAGCQEHIDTSRAWLDANLMRCRRCDRFVTGYRVVPL